MQHASKHVLHLVILDVELGQTHDLAVRHSRSLTPNPRASTVVGLPLRRPKPRGDGPIRLCCSSRAFSAPLARLSRGGGHADKGGGLRGVGGGAGDAHAISGRIASSDRSIIHAIPLHARVGEHRLKDARPSRSPGMPYEPEMPP